MSSYSDQLLLHSLFLPLSLLSLLAICCFGHAEVECLPGQRSLLLSLKDGFSFRYTDDKLLSWTPGSNCCDWEGVSCDPSSGHVIRLDLSNRYISGNISSSLFKLKSLQTLNLAYNSFDGPLLQSGFEMLTKLIHLNLSECVNGGQIPIGISRLTKLISLDLSWNKIQLWNPNFQTLVRNFSHLRELHLDGVSISSGINWSETLSISLPRLQVLTLIGCNVSGILPHNFFLLRNWTTLDLRGNQILSGLLRGFPENSHLEVLGLSPTFITGSLGNSIGNLKYLRELRISGEGRMQTGMIPSSIGNLTRLVLLDLSFNNLKGNLPSECFNEMKVMMNNSQLDSSIVGFSYFNASGLYQSIISVTSKGEDITLEKFLTTYTYIDLSNNKFQGNIPDAIGNLQGLHVLNFSHNALTGQIPSTIGNLSQLESLDLSENRLSGTIPHELDALSFLEVLNVSNNNLVGRIPDGTQFSTFPNTSFEGNPGLCGEQLSKLCDNATPNRTSEMSQLRSDSSSSTYVIGLALFVGIGFGVGIALVLVLQNIPLRFWKKHDNN